MRSIAYSWPVCRYSPGDERRGEVLTCDAPCHGRDRDPLHNAKRWICTSDAHAITLAIPLSEAGIPPCILSDGRCYQFDDKRPCPSREGE